MVCLLVLVLPMRASGQAGQTDADSLRSYELAEIVVGGEEVEDLLRTTMHRVSLASLVREDAASVSEVARLIPSAAVQTNSRGETLVYIRNAGERQVALFFDGALLNIPWDNRVDLSLVPSGALGGMTVAKGVPSVLYGTNVIGGAINLTSRSLGRDGTFTEATAMAGAAGLRRGVVTHLRRRGPFSFAGSIGYATRDGITLPDEAPLPYSQPSSRRRTNTDRQLFDLFGRASYRFHDGGEAGVSLFHVDGEKGVAPESHLDPAVDRVRFWRYPLWQNTMLIVNATRPLAGGGFVKGSVWGSRFAQHIDQYEDATYRTLTDREEDLDLTLGGRFQWLKPLGHGALTASLNLLTSRHEQVDAVFEDGRAIPDPELTYQQHIFSLGLEYDVALSSSLSMLAGGSLDGIATPRTGDKPARDPSVDAGVIAGLVYRLSPVVSWKASVGRKVRFPTMRELFGAALNQFLVNPDLKPESSLLAETGFVFGSTVVAGEVLAFVNRTFDTIDQHRVTVDGRRLRQRINLEGSRVYGVELVGTVEPMSSWDVEGHLTWMKTRAFEAGPDRVLVEKPEWLGTLTAVYTPTSRFSLMVQGVYTGRAYGMGPENDLTPLPTSLAFNARVAYRFFLPGDRLFGEFFLRVDNLTDTLVMPQLGLPGPGREFRGGLSLSL